MSNKSRVNFTVDPYVLERFDNVVSNRSKRLEEFMKKTAEIEEGRDRDLIEEKQRLEREISNLNDEIEEKKSKKASRESELKALKSALEQENQTKKMVENAVENLTPKWEEFRKKTHDSNKASRKLATTKIFHTWVEKIDLDKEKLKQKVRENSEL